jgi:hypothetical protein
MNVMAGLLTLGSSLFPRLPGSFGDEPVTKCGNSPRTQRRVRTGFKPVSLLGPRGAIKFHDKF